MKKMKLFICAAFVFILLVSGCDSLELGAGSESQEYSEEEILEMMQGFWVLTGHEGNVSEEIKRGGVALKIDDDEMDLYSGFSRIDKDIKIKISDDTIEYYDDGTQIELEISFETVDGYELMILSSDGGTSMYEKTTKDAFYLYQGFIKNEEGTYDHSTYIYDNLTDKELEWYISDIYWHELYYLYADGTMEDMNPYTMVMFSSDMRGIMEYTDKTEYVEWEVYDSKLYVTYDTDDETYYFPIDYEYDSTTGYAYLYLYDTNEGFEECAWVLWYEIE